MSKFIIKGGYKLAGEIEVKGMKNAATPVLSATLLTDETCEIGRLPDILDVRAILDIMESLGAKINRKKGRVEINAREANILALDKNKVQAMRSSILLLAPLLARFKKVKIPSPGGCIIGNRPIDTHLYVFKKLGAQIIKEGDEYSLSCPQLKGANIILPEFSVTATENALMAAVCASGETVIKMAAAEPHVQDLAVFLGKMGAKIEGAGTHTIKIKGVKKLHGVSHEIIPDQIEVGTFAVAAAATHSEILIKNVVPEHLDIILVKLSEIGVKYELGPDYLRILPSTGYRAFKLQSLPYPGFPTDLQAPFSILATQAKGTSLIHDPLFEARLSHIQELIKMGANAVICDPHRVLISGPTPLFGQEIKSPDLRAGATLIIAGLIANGITEISQAEIIDRGYEQIETRLSRLGAKIERIND
ncbi:MAG: UDP-N-acetylglucosamine 1-carboxyvinyltransferase [Patescibacteria group bacterium]